MNKYQHLLNTLRDQAGLMSRLDRSNWKIGDDVAKICKKQGFIDTKELNLLYEEVKKAKLDKDYTKQFLQRVGQVAIIFPPITRKAGYSWTLHNEAGSPEMLEKLLSATDGKPDARKASGNVSKLKKVFKKKPHLKPTPLLGLYMKAVRQLEQSEHLIETVEETIQPHISSINDEMVKGLVDLVLSIQNKVVRLRSMIEVGRPKRMHLREPAIVGRAGADAA